MDRKYDIVIVGSGLGGLLCGAILSKNGFSVCILEKHFQIGGNIQTFKRDGCVFSAGMHFIGGMEHDQILYKLFNYIGIADKIKVQKLDEDCFQKIYLHNEEFSYAMGLSNFKDTMISYFPDEQVAIEKYIQKLEEVWNGLDTLNLRNRTDYDSMPSDSIAVNAFDFINSLTENKKLVAVLTATNGLYAGVSAKTPLFVHALINCFFIKSAYKLDEREVTLAQLLVEAIEQNGGIVLKSKEVVKFEFENDKIIGAQIKDGSIIYGENFISNIHPLNTIKLAGESKFRKAFVHRLLNLENTESAFGLYITLKKNTFKHINSDVYYFPDDDVWGIDSYNSKPWPIGYAMYTTPEINNEEFAESITVHTFMKYDEVKEWESTRIGKRGDAYLNFKKEHAEKLLDLIEVKFPDVRSCLKAYYSSTPLTYRDYTGTPEGAMYGSLKDNNNHLNSFLTTRTKIPNLFQTGQNIQLHGILGVAMCALHTSTVFLDYDQLVTDIRNG